MRNVYRSIVASLGRLFVGIHVLKTWVFEWVSVMRRCNQYRNVVWSHDQQKGFDDFWITHYGKKISNRWHRLYQSANGVFDVSYFPEILYSTKLEPKLNQLDLANVLQDKSMIEVLYGTIPGISFPRTIVLNCSGIYYDSTRNLIDKQEAMALLYNAGKVVIKPIKGGSSGRGVCVLEIENGVGQDQLSVEEIISRYGVDFIVQEYLKQNRLLSNVYSHSVNTIRIVTYILNDCINHLPIAIRVGARGNRVDNIHAGGIAIGISDSGELNSIGYDNDNRKYIRHPDTGVVFRGYTLPFIQDIIDSAYSVHSKTPHIGIASWDFTVDDRDQVVLIESNLVGQSIWFPQIVNARPAFGENTRDVLRLISRQS